MKRIFDVLVVGNGLSGAATKKRIETLKQSSGLTVGVLEQSPAINTSITVGNISSGMIEKLGLRPELPIFQLYKSTNMLWLHHKRSMFSPLYTPLSKTKADSIGNNEFLFMEKDLHDELWKKDEMERNGARVHLLKNFKATKILEERDVVRGVKAIANEEEIELEAGITIFADGLNSLSACGSVPNPSGHQTEVYSLHEELYELTPQMLQPGNFSLYLGYPFSFSVKHCRIVYVTELNGYLSIALYCSPGLSYFHSKNFLRLFKKNDAIAGFFDETGIEKIGEKHQLIKEDNAIAFAKNRSLLVGKSSKLTSLSQTQSLYHSLLSGIVGGETAVAQLKSRQTEGSTKVFLTVRIMVQSLYGVPGIWKIVLTVATLIGMFETIEAKKPGAKPKE
uniref:Squalene monooxygenase n=1 Tax=Ditylenchus dipsaci TaxID=166011 RepID=A0A915DSA2_9BILA